MVQMYGWIVILPFFSNLLNVQRLIPSRTIIQFGKGVKTTNYSWTSIFQKILNVKIFQHKNGVKILISTVLLSELDSFFGGIVDLTTNSLQIYFFSFKWTLLNNKWVDLQAISDISI